MPGGPTLLHYETTDPRPSHWPLWMRRALAQWQRLPLPIASTILLVPADGLTVLLPIIYDDRHDGLRYIACSMAPLFFAIAIRGNRWRDILIAAVLICGAVAIQAWNRVQVDPFFLAFELRPFSGLVRECGAVALAGLAAWLALEYRSWGALGWVLAGAIAAGAIDQGVLTFLRLAHVQDSLPGRGELFGFVPPLIWTLAGSLGIVWGLRARREGRFHRAALAGAAVAAVGGYVLVYGPALVPLACHSMRGHGPFPRDEAVWIIDRFGSPADTQCLCDALDREAGLTGRLTRAGMSLDWMGDALSTLEFRDSPRAAEWYSRHLRTRPSAALADRAARLFADQDRYDAVPIMLRYALFDPWSTVQAPAALGRMRIPYAALHILGTYPSATLDEKTETRLTDLLKIDLGADRDAWIRYRWFSNKISLLNPSLAAESDLLFDAFCRYIKAIRISHTKFGHVPPPNLDAPTTAQFIADIDAYIERVNALPAKGGVPSTEHSGGK